MHIKHYILNWANFSGRASRSEFWWGILAYYIYVFIASLISAAVTLPISLILPDELYVVSAIVSGIVALLVMIPAMIAIIALIVRRFHDVGKSGWMYLVCCLLSFCCGIGGIMLIYYMVIPGTPGPNQYGDAVVPMSNNNIQYQNQNNMQYQNQNNMQYQNHNNMQYQNHNNMQYQNQNVSSRDNNY